MRKATSLLFALLLTLLLTACGDGGKEAPAELLQREYGNVSAAVMEADVTCHYGGEERCYTLLCRYTPEESTVTVLSPKDIAGVSAVVRDGKLSLSYDDISLDAGDSTGAASPAVVLPRLIEAAGHGYIREQSREIMGDRDCLRLAMDLPGDEETLYVTWFDHDAMVPLKSEISVDGAVMFQVLWSRFEVESMSHDADDMYIE